MSTMTSRVNLDDLRDAKLNDFIEDVANGTLEFYPDEPIHCQVPLIDRYSNCIINTIGNSDVFLMQIMFIIVNVSALSLGADWLMKS